ncbi:MAG: hypothetical protein MUE73_15240 [Planctomycetes bacterium]|jgi:hypothetical protein|nr:hypothetical protein [Planctomycetota bacterium]
MSAPAGFAPAFCVLLLVALSGPARSDEKNLVDNPSFEESGEDPVPKWTVRRIAGLTEFRTGGGRLVAERRAGGSGSPDSLLQSIFLPPKTEGLRISVRAAAEKMTDARLVLNLRARDWKSLGGVAAFHFRGTFPLRLLDRDIRLAPDVNDVELNIDVRGEGKLVLDEISVIAIPEARVRDEARVARVDGKVRIAAPGEVRVPVPPPTETQCPVSLSFRAEPGGALSEAKILPAEDGRQEIALVAGPDVKSIAWSARVVVVERPDYRALPEAIPFPGGRVYEKRITRFAEPPGGEPPIDLAGEKDLRAATRRLTLGSGDPGGKAEGAVRSLRARRVPARRLLLSPIGSIEPGHAFEAYQKDLGWLRFGTYPDDPRPLPCGDFVLLLTWPPGDAPSLAPIEGAETAEVGAFPVEKGGAPDLVSSLAEAWFRYPRAVEAGESLAIDPSKISLKGKAAKLKARLPEILGIE